MSANPFALVKDVEKLSPTRVKITVELSNEAVKQREKAALNKVRSQAKVPGFRPGKAPAEMIQKKYGDEIRSTAVSDLLHHGLEHALEETKLYPITRPSLKLKGDPLAEGNTFSFDAEFEIKPDIQLKDYKGIEIEIPKVTVEDSEVDEAIEHLRDQLAVLEPTSDQKATKGQFAVIDMSLQIPNLNPPKSIDSRVYTVEVGNGKLLPEIDAALMEMKVGEGREIKAVFPADYSEPTLAGQEGHFKIQFQEIKKKTLPEVNDAFASQIKKDATLLSLRSEIRTDLQARKEDQLVLLKKNLVMEKLLKSNHFEIPSSMLSQQVEVLKDQIKMEDQRQGRERTDFSKEELDGIHKRAENQVRGMLILGQVATREDLKLDEKAVEQRVKELAQQMNRPVDETRKWLVGKNVMGRIEQEIFTDQIFNFLVSQASVKTKA